VPKINPETKFQQIARSTEQQPLLLGGKEKKNQNLGEANQHWDLETFNLLKARAEWRRSRNDLMSFFLKRKNFPEVKRKA